MISSLLMVEGAFNITGYMSFLVRAGTLNPLTMAWWILLLFVPFYILFAIIHYRVNRITGGLLMIYRNFRSKRFCLVSCIL